MHSTKNIDTLQFDEKGLITAVVTEVSTHEVLMVAYMNRKSLELTIAKQQAVFYSRSRKELWHKGATSGNVLIVHDIKVDCDGDCLLLEVSVQGDGVACHTGAHSCFFSTLEK